MTTNAKPAFGRAIVKRLEPGTTAAGLYVGGSEYRWILVSTSDGHTVDGHFVKAEGKPGDYVILGRRREIVDIKGKKHEQRVYNTQDSDLLPRDHVIVLLHEIQAYVTPSAVPEEWPEGLPRIAQGGAH
jgi:hypothetical protein